MSITQSVRSRLHDYAKKNDLSYYKIHQEIIRSGGEITYNTLRAFSASESDGSGNTLDLIDKFLSKKGY